MQRPSVIAVIDIGKTNKKVLLFSRDLELLDSVYKSFDEYEEDGIRYEDVENAFHWILDQLAAFSPSYRIEAISVTTHGATAMCLDKDGNLAVPPVAYTTEADEAFRNEFFERFGSPEELQRETATAEVGSLVNLGKLIFFLQKKWPQQFADVEQILYYPQYFGFRLTGRAGAEPTYTGCHTYLYDVRNHQPSSVARGLGVADKIPFDISRSWETLGTLTPEIAERTGIDADCVVTMGIHDSNASLLPYLVQGYDNFVLNSTGTWCVAMHPTERVDFRADELGKLVFYNLDAFFNPVKTSIFMGGQEFETYNRILADIHGPTEWPAFDPALFARVAQERKLFVLPSVVKGTGIFPDARPRVIEGDREYQLADIQSGKAVPEFFRDRTLADAVLVLSLAAQTTAALDIAGYDGKGTVFTEGGFRHNTRYNPILSQLYPEGTCCLTELQEATAFGAALLGRAALDGTDPMALREAFRIRTKAVPPAEVPGLHDYTKQFFERLRQ